MTFEEILPHLRAGKRIIRTSQITGWSKLQDHFWYQIYLGRPVLRQLFGDGRLTAEDLEAQDWEIYGEPK